MEPHRPCPACDGTFATPLGQKNGFSVALCSRCTTLYTPELPPRIDSGDYDRFYSAEHLRVPAFVERRMDEIVAGFAPYRKGNRLLDVGFGSGVLLQAAARAGWDAEGIELSEAAVAHARRLGLRAHVGDLSRYPDGHFDVLAASEVIEHLPSPATWLREAFRVLREGGLLWGTTPHGRGLSAKLLGLRWSNVMPPEHLQLFSVRGMKTLLGRAGFRSLRLRTHGANPFEIYYCFRYGLRQRGAGPDIPLYGRVKSSQDLNQFLLEGPARKALKDLLNGILSRGRLGDSLKIQAEK